MCCFHPTVDHKETVGVDKPFILFPDFSFHKNDLQFATSFIGKTNCKDFSIDSNIYKPGRLFFYKIIIIDRFGTGRQFIETELVFYEVTGKKECLDFNDLFKINYQ